MDPKNSIWQRIGLQDWFLTSENTSGKKKQSLLTPDDVYNYFTTNILLALTLMIIKSL
jgi:hypothetical protein